MVLKNKYIVVIPILVVVVLILSLFVMPILSLYCGYGTNRNEYLNITFDSKLSTAYLRSYIDSVLLYELPQKQVPDSIINQFVGKPEYDKFVISETDRLVYLGASDEEWYLISLQSAPCDILEIYNPRINPKSVIAFRDALGKKEIERIRTRFTTQILDKAIEYYKARGVPDYLLFIQCRY